MGQKQLHRWHVVKIVEVGKITLRETTGEDGCILMAVPRLRDIRARIEYILPT